MFINLWKSRLKSQKFILLICWICIYKYYFEFFFMHNTLYNMVIEYIHISTEPWWFGLYWVARQPAGQGVFFSPKTSVWWNLFHSHLRDCLLNFNWFKHCLSKGNPRYDNSDNVLIIWVYSLWIHLDHNRLFFVICMYVVLKLC